jgi:mevalonate kinase
MADGKVLEALEEYKSKVLGWKISGAGGGGYLILVAEEPERVSNLRVRGRI